MRTGRLRAVSHFAASASVAVAAAGLAAGGATASEPPEAATLDMPDGVTVDLLFLRGQELNRRAALRVSNGSGETVTVASAQLRSPFFEIVSPADTDVLIPSGRTIDVLVDYGPSVCPAPTAPTLAELVVTVGDGETRSGVIVLPDHSALMRNGRECDQRFVTDQVDVTFSDEFSVDGDVVHTTLELDRVSGSDPISVDYIRGTVTMSVEPDSDTTPVAVVKSDNRSVAIPLMIWVGRCDEHAVIESKRNYHFRVWVSVGEVHEQLLIVQVPEGSDLWSALETLMYECVTT